LTPAALAEEADSRLEITDERSAGTEQKFSFSGISNAGVEPTESRRLS
jgi:hypothetical protein